MIIPNCRLICHKNNIAVKNFFDIKGTDLISSGQTSVINGKYLGLSSLHLGLQDYLKQLPQETRHLINIEPFMNQNKQ